jgi:hypothetical protein
MFTIVRIFADANGDSHFEEQIIPFEEEGAIGKLSMPYPASNVIFREVEPTYDYDFHTAPQRQYIILLDGEIETSLHEKRIFRGGDILLVEDTTGKGHKTKNLQPIERKSIFISLP